MSDWFLRAFRKTPPRDFRQQLYAHLEAEERRLALLWRSTAAVLLILIALSPTFLNALSRSSFAPSRTSPSQAESTITSTVPEWEQELPAGWVYYPPGEIEAFGPMDYRAEQKRRASPAETPMFIAMVIPGERR